MKTGTPVVCAVCAAFAVGAFAFQSPLTSDVRPLSGVTRSTIKPFSPTSDGINWLHGVALCWHGDRLYASFGVNTGEVIVGNIGSEKRTKYGVTGRHPGYKKYNK